MISAAIYFFLLLESLCTSKKNQDRCYELIVECVFLEKKSDKGNQKGNQVGLTVFQEFQLVLVLVQYFSRPGPDVTRNDVFLCLFGHTTLTQIRSRVLSKFISTAISDSIAPVCVCLSSTRPWLPKLLKFCLAVICLNRFFVQLEHGCNRSDQIPWHAWNWHNDSSKILLSIRNHAATN